MLVNMNQMQKFRDQTTKISLKLKIKHAHRECQSGAMFLQSVMGRNKKWQLKLPFYNIE